MSRIISGLSQPLKLNSFYYLFIICVSPLQNLKYTCNIFGNLLALHVTLNSKHWGCFCLLLLKYDIVCLIDICICICNVSSVHYWLWPNSLCFYMHLHRWLITSTLDIRFLKKLKVQHFAMGGLVSRQFMICLNWHNKQKYLSVHSTFTSEGIVINFKILTIFFSSCEILSSHMNQ